MIYALTRAGDGSIVSMEAYQIMDEIYTAASMASELEKRAAQLAPEWTSRQPDLAARLAGALAESPEQMLVSMSYEEFLTWADEDIHAEWVDGKVYRLTPASRRHQLLARHSVLPSNGGQRRNSKQRVGHRRDSSAHRGRHAT
jgi:hypothetical protein